MNIKTPQPTTGFPSAALVVRRMIDPLIVMRGRVVIIGLGGIGLYLSRAVLTFLGGVLQASLPGPAGGTRSVPAALAGHRIEVWVCDGDSFAPENTYRMDIPDYGNKSVALGQELLDRFDVPGLIIRWRDQYVDESNVGDMIRDGDCVLLACDNHDTRNLVGRRCAETDLGSVVLISGGNDGVEDGLRGTYGNVQVYWKEQGRELTAPIQQFHPEIANPADRSPARQSCLEQAAAGAAQLSFVNLAVASAMCNALLRMMMPVPDERMYDEAALDILDARMLPHWLSGPQEK
jgi:hypothetical protein